MAEFLWQKNRKNKTDTEKTGISIYVKITAMIRVFPELFWEISEAAGVSCEGHWKLLATRDEEAARLVARKMCGTVVGSRGLFQRT